MNVTHLHRHFMRPEKQLWCESKCTRLARVFDSFPSVFYHTLSPLVLCFSYRSGDWTGLRKWSSSALMNQSCSSTSCDPERSSQQWKALNPLKWQCLIKINYCGKLLKDQQTHTEMSVQEGAIKPASGQPCSCQANLCEGVHPLWIYAPHVVLRQNVPNKWQQGKKSR